MQGNAEVIEILNEVLTAELTAINQYFIDAKMCDNWGLDKLGAKFKHESIDEMKDAEAPIERLTRGIELCYDRGDHGSRDLLEHILEGEEEHADWLETQLALVASLGEALFLAQQVDPS